METETHSLPWQLSPSQRGGVIFMATIGGVSTLVLLILISHIISVSFIPLCISALNSRHKFTPIPYTSPAGNSNSCDTASVSGASDGKSNMASSQEGGESRWSFSADKERTRMFAERRARARAIELSRLKSKNNEERMFLRMQLGVFIVCMLLSDLIQSLGGVIQARWAYLGRVEQGTACWVQAAMIAFGDVSTAVWNTVIACHTFATVVLGIRMSSLGVSVVVICGWTFPILTSVIGSIIANPKHDYYDVAGTWCFISNAYYIERVVLHYVPLLVASAIITIMYTLVSLTMRGNLRFTQVSSRLGIPWFSITFRRTSMHLSETGSAKSRQIAYLRSLSIKMLWYPCVYTCLILPISICRMVELQGHKAPFELLFFTMVLLFLVGLSNAVIYVTTRNVGISHKDRAIHSINAPNNGTQADIYIDRVTQRDIDIVSFGGTALGTQNREKASTKSFDDLDLDDLERSC